MEWESGGKRRIRLRNLRSWAWLLGKSLKSEPAFEPQNGRGKHRFCASVVENRVVSCRPERIQMGEDPHGYTINDPSPLYSFDFPHGYWKIIHPKAICDRLQNSKDIIRMGTRFSHILDSRSPVRIVGFHLWVVCKTDFYMPPKSNSGTYATSRVLSNPVSIGSESSGACNPQKGVT